MNDIADFRSDTLTRPCPAMRAAMAEAEVGDDVFGEDPTIRELEAKAAEVLGKPGSLFVPSGTMANQIAVHGHCRPGDELIGEERSHVMLYEGGGLARWSGTTAKTRFCPDGFLAPEDLPSLVRADDPHFPRSRLLLIENSHNVSGGRTLGPAGMDALCAAAKDLDLKVHIDGARLINAAVAEGCAPADLTRGADSVSLCLSKGLGAPVGSVLAGDEAFLYTARRTRKALGGGMRQAGILAAAGLLALREGPGRLALDHQRARTVATAIAAIPHFAVDVDAVKTNILMVDTVGHEAASLVEAMAAEAIRFLPFGPHRFRLVFHRDLTDEHVARLIAALQTFTPS